MLENAMKEQLKEYFKRMTSRVELLVSLGDNQESEKMNALAEDLMGISEMLIVRLDGKHENTPSISLGAEEKPHRIVFSGVPSGHEFSSLVLAIMQVGGVKVKADEDTIRKITSLKGGYDFKIFVSMDCHNCPDVVQALNSMAMVNEGVSVELIDGATFPKLAEDMGVMAVPTVFMNGVQFSQGRSSLEEIVEKLGAESISDTTLYDVLVVGGGPAGVTSAIYAARKGLKVSMIAERLGGQVLDTVGIENFISTPYTEGPILAKNLESHLSSYEVKINKGKRVQSISKEEGIFNLGLSDETRIRGRSVILALGAKWRELGVPGEDRLRGHGVAYCPHCDGPFFKGKDVAVIGGGNSGVEAAIDLANIVRKVTLLEFDSKLRADKVLQDKLLSLPNVKVITNAKTLEVKGEEKVSALTYEDRGTGTIDEVALDGIFIQIGLLPNTQWLDGVLDRNRFGEIVIDSKCKTSVDGIFAAGDATEVPFKQIVIAIGEGAKASLSAFDYLMRL